MPLSLLSSLTTRDGKIRRGRAQERARGVNFLAPEKEGEDGPEEVERRAEISALGILSALRERKRVSGQEQGEGVGQKAKKGTEEFGHGRRRQKGRKECRRRERKRGATGREREEEEEEFPSRTSTCNGKFLS